MLDIYNSKAKRKIERHSNEMNEFLKAKALEEQEQGLSTTHLLIDNRENKLIGYISLCNDSLKLVAEEKDMLNMPYRTIPAVKIARLAIDNNYRGMSFAKFLLGYTTILIARIQRYSGVAIVTLDCFEEMLNFYTLLGFKLNSIQPNTNLHYDNLCSLRITVYKLADVLSKVAIDV